MNRTDSLLKDRALDAAENALNAHFGGANCAYVAGSIMRGEGTLASDIDLVVLFPILERAWRESFIHDGFPVEAFVHDPETLRYFMNLDVAGGCPVMISMLASGVIVGREKSLAQTIQLEARDILAAGPKTFAGQIYDTLRYQISDLADDLRGERPPEEVAAIATVLYQKLSDLVLVSRGAWTGRGKWTPRLLRQLDNELAGRFEMAFLLAAQGEAAALLALTEAELALHGGHYFAGYKMEAALEARCVDKAAPSRQGRE